jgi:hypothetical protein
VQRRLLLGFKHSKLSGKDCTTVHQAAIIFSNACTPLIGCGGITGDSKNLSTPLIHLIFISLLTRDDQLHFTNIQEIKGIYVYLYNVLSQLSTMSDTSTLQS